MPWTWERIERLCLRGGRVAILEETAVNAFNRVERFLGEDWIHDQLARATGPLPTVWLVSAGTRLEALEGVAGTDVLLHRLRRDLTDDAWQELSAMFLASTRAAELELEPPILIGAQTRYPDFRVRELASNDPRWVYVEVVAPTRSQERVRLHQVMERIAASVTTGDGDYALDVALTREPAELEVISLLDRMGELAKAGAAVVDELPNGLGWIAVNQVPPGHVEIDGSLLGDRPAFGTASVWNEPPNRRHVSVRIALGEERAEEIIKRKARQLPTHAPTLLMLSDLSFRRWRPQTESVLGRGKHTRVSAVCLFATATTTRQGAEAWAPAAQLLTNPHARHGLPDWLTRRLMQFALASPLEQRRP